MDCKFYMDNDGNMYEAIEKGNNTLKEVKPNSVDAASEKHVPKISKENGKLKVEVGEIYHPMEEEHNISWVEQVSEDKRERKYLKPNQEPVVYFEDIPSTIYAYCNKHGLWESQNK